MTSRTVSRVLVAPTAFKGRLGPCLVARALAAGVAQVWPEAEIVERPLSDGGNGLLESYQALGGGTIEKVAVSGPLGGLTDARWLRAESLAVIESAEACGLHLVPPAKRDPLRATTRGVGELLLAASQAGTSEIYLGLGGSATVDGGCGMARALGWRFLDERGRALPEGGGALVALARLEPPQRELRLRVVALCDVENPLLGPHGAARVYGPQKGAGPAEVDALERGLARLAAVVEEELGRAVEGVAGAGAAGGLGAGSNAFLGAELVSGAHWMAGRARLSEALQSADLVLTGEGRFDVQSSMGKATGVVIGLARAAGVPVLLVCGAVEGSVPDGVIVSDSGGAMLDEESLSELAEAGCRAYSGGDRL